MPGLKWALPWAGIAFWLSFFGLNCVQMAPGRAESDFGLQGWIDTLELKQIFLIFSVCKNAFTFLEIEINFKESQLPFGWEKRIRATRKWPINSLQTHPKKGFFWGYPLPLPKWYNNWFLPIFGVCEKLYLIYNISHLLWIKSTWKM